MDSSDPRGMWPARQKHLVCGHREERTSAGMMSRLNRTEESPGYRLSTPRRPHLPPCLDAQTP